MYRFKSMKDKLFIALGKALKEAGVGIEFESRFEDGKIVYLDTPEVRGAMGPFGEGYYFRADHYYDFSSKEIDSIEQVMSEFNFDGQSVKLISIDSPEHDDDRIWKASITFIIS